jgi:hypothetical protein
MRRSPNLRYCIRQVRRGDSDAPLQLDPLLSHRRSGGCRRHGRLPAEEYCRSSFGAALSRERSLGSDRRIRAINPRHVAPCPDHGVGCGVPRVYLRRLRRRATSVAPVQGWRATVRAIGGLRLFGGIAAFPPCLLAFSVWVVHGKIAAFAVGLVSLLTGSLPAWAYRRRVWEAPVRRPLARRTAFDPRGAQVSVNVARADIEAAWGAIRRAGLVVVYTRTRGDPLALPLNSTISVARPVSPTRLTSMPAAPCARSSAQPRSTRT